jgi:hypothetical protein
MSSTTQFNPRRLRWAGIAAAAVGLTISGALLAPQAFGGADPAGQGPAGELNPAVSQPAAGSSMEVSEPPAVDPAEAAAEVTYQRGIVLAGSGTLDRREVFVEIYGNDIYASQATVVVNQPGGPNLAANVDVSIEDLLAVEFEFDAQLDRMTRGGPVPTHDDVTGVGSWVHSGTPTPIEETYEDAGYLFNVTGTNTPVEANIVVTIGGVDVPVQLHEAFAFDLTITATPL